MLLSMLLVCVGSGGRWEKGWHTRAVFYRRTRPLSDGTDTDKGLVLSTLLPKEFVRGASPPVSSQGSSSVRGAFCRVSIMLAF